MKALVTGATGFIGGHLVDALVSRGVEVTALVRSAARAKRLPDGVRLETGDLEDGPALQRATADQDTIFHVAGVVAARNEQAFLRANRDGTRNLLAAAAGSGRPRVVLLSSLAAGGPNGRCGPRSIDAPDRPITAYGRSKLAGEACVRESALPWTILRPPMVYGPRDTEVLKVFRLVRRGVAPLFGDGLQALSAIFATDLAEAMIAAAAADATAGRTYAVCHPEVFTNEQLIRTISHALGRDVRIVRLPTGLGTLVLTVTGAVADLTGRATLLNRDKAAELFAPAWTADPMPLHRDAGWMAATDLRTGMTATAHAYRAAGWIT